MVATEIYHFASFLFENGKDHAIPARSKTTGLHIDGKLIFSLKVYHHHILVYFSSEQIMWQWRFITSKFFSLRMANINQYPPVQTNYCMCAIITCGLYFFYPIFHSGLYWAASHLVPNTFSPRTFGPPQLVPKNKQSRLIWSPWTNGPQDNWSRSTNSPSSFGHHGQMVPKTIGPPGQLVPKIYPCKPTQRHELLSAF